jgi:hypothetical protein
MKIARAARREERGTIFERGRQFQDFRNLGREFVGGRFAGSGTRRRVGDALAAGGFGPSGALDAGAALEATGCGSGCNDGAG